MKRLFIFELVMGVFRPGAEKKESYPACLTDKNFLRFIFKGIIQYYPEDKERKEEDLPTKPSERFLLELRDDPDGLTQTLIRSEALYVELARYMFLHYRQIRANRARLHFPANCRKIRCSKM